SHALCDRRQLRAFPTRRSSDLRSAVLWSSAHVVTLAPSPSARTSTTRWSRPVKSTDVTASSRRELTSCRSGETSTTSCRSCSVKSEEHTSELQSRENLVCRLLL